MTKRLLFLSAAFALLSGLAFQSPSQAGSVSIAFSVSPPSQTVTATPVGNGSAHTTITSTSGTQMGTATSAPTPASPMTIASFSETATGNGVQVGPGGVTVNGGSYSAQTATETVKIYYPSNQSLVFGTITVTESFNGFSFAGSYVTPTVTTSGPVTIGKYKFSVIPGSAAAVTSNGGHTGTIQIAIQYSAIPEPASMGLLGIGMAGIYAFRRLFNRRNSEV